MSDMNLQLTLKSGKDVYRPGESMRGTVTITAPGGPTEVKGVDLIVYWRTSGIGTDDSAVVHSEVLLTPGAKLPTFFTKEFQITLPHQPWTYAGRLIKINWYIGLYVKLPWRKDLDTEIPFQLRPEGMGPAGELPDPGDGPFSPESAPDIFYDDRGRPLPKPLDI